MNDKNVTIIQNIYSAFGRGDIPAILAQVNDDTKWSFNVNTSEVPWHAKVEGKSALPRFFNDFVQNVELKTFEPRRFVHSGDDVIAHIHIEYKVKKTGKDVSMDQLHWWTLDREGKIARLVHFEDTAQVISAYSG
jgi:hypothetical protein